MYIVAVVILTTLVAWLTHAASGNPRTEVKDVIGQQGRGSIAPTASILVTDIGTNHEPNQGLGHVATSAFVDR